MKAGDAGKGSADFMRSFSSSRTSLRSRRLPSADAVMTSPASLVRGKGGSCLEGMQLRKRWLGTVRGQEEGGITVETLCVLLHGRFL